MTMSGAKGGWDQWQWDGTLFAGAAAYYRQGRMPYAEGLADAMADALHLDGHGRLIDMGCGPGVVALRRAHLFDDVTGLDPDADMLTEGTQQAEALKITNVNWIRMKAEDLTGALGRFRIATFAASFHWMDRPKVAHAVWSVLEPGGAAVQVDAPSYRTDDRAGLSTTDLPHPPPPDDAMTELRTRYLGPDLRAGRGIRNSSPDGEDAVFRASGFLPMRRVVVPDGRSLTRTVDDLVALRLSSSSTAPHLFGDRIGDVEADLRRLLVEAPPSGLFSVCLPDNVISIWELDT
jgi:SAM-dependent methyltransferase